MPNYLPGIYLSQESVDALTDILPYTFNDLILLSEAFEAAGSSPAEEGNKRQAHIGDVVLRLVLYLDGRSHNASTGNFTTSDMHAKIVTNAQRLFSKRPIPCSMIGPRIMPVWQRRDSSRVSIDSSI